MNSLFGLLFDLSKNKLSNLFLNNQLLSVSNSNKVLSSNPLLIPDIAGVIISWMLPNDNKSMRLVCKLFNKIILTNFDKYFIKITPHDGQYKIVRIDGANQFRDKLKIYQGCYHISGLTYTNYAVSTWRIKIDFVFDHNSKLHLIFIYGIYVGDVEVIPNTNRDFGEVHIKLDINKFIMIRQAHNFIRSRGYLIELPNIYVHPDSYERLEKINRSLYDSSD